MIDLLTDPDFQRTLGFYGGGAAAVIGALWVVFTKFFAGSKPPPPSVEANKGVAAGGNLRVGGDIQVTSTPKAAWLVLGLGLLLLGAVALFGRGDCTAEVSGAGVAACGDVTGARVAR